MTPRHLQALRLHALNDEARKKASGKTKPDRSVRPGMSDWHITIGQLVHRCAGELAEHRTESLTTVAALATEWINENARDTTVLGNLSKARAQVCSMTCAYLSRYAPGPDAQYLGTEVRLGDCRVDLAWFVPDLGVVIDELKTTAWVSLRVDAAMLGQPQMYRELGVAEWGERFAGVRFLPLRNPHEARFITAEGNVLPLGDSPATVITTELP